MKRRWLLVVIVVAAQLLLSARFAPAAPSALNAFDDAWSKIEHYAVTLKVHEVAGPIENGEATDELDLKIANPTNDINRTVLYLSKSTHMPVRQLRYAGDKMMTDESWRNFHPNVGLKVSDFPF